MTLRLFARLFAAVTIGGLALLAPVAAQEATVPFGIQLTEWTLTLDRVEREAEASILERLWVNELKVQLAEVRTEAEQAEREAEARLIPLHSQLVTIGPRPEVGATAEPPDIAAQRERLEAVIAAIDAHVKQAELIIERANELDRRITALARKQLIDRLSTAFPFPLAPGTVAVAVPEFFEIVGEIVDSPFVWWHSLGPADRSTVSVRVAIVLPLAFVIGLLIRIALRRWFVRDPTVEDPTYLRRLTAAIAQAAATGIVPALIFAGFLYRAASEGVLISGPFRELVIGFCIAMILTILAWALPRSVLAPDSPNWRLIPVKPKNARKISTRISALAAIAAVDLLLRLFGEHRETSNELVALYIFVVSGLEAGLLLTLTPSRMWSEDEETAPRAPEAAEEEPSNDTPRLWRYLRRTISVAAAVAIVAAFLGFSYLSAYLTSNLVISSVVVGLLVLVRGVLREMIGAAFRSRFLMAKLHIPHRLRMLFKFWFRVALDVVLFYVAIVIITPTWGFPQGDVWRLTGQFLSGFKIGNVTISIADILVAFFAFLAAIVLTRMVQRGLEEQVLPHTRLDIGVRNSIKTGIGYIGIALAALIAIALLGLDLSNLAIIAGALSVGIGFGLQSVVNNFVSGMIILVERPIKSGDWIVVGGHEGFVRRINVRATEIETFERASIIIPNSEVLSAALINLTHKNQYGRVDVNVGVAYGSDADQVMTILRECLDAHPQVLRIPEPSVVFLGFGESSLDFQARGFIDHIVRRIFVRSDLLTEIYRRFNEAGIEIPFPQRDLHLKDIDRLEAVLANRPEPPAAKPRRRSTDGADEKK